MGAHLLVMAMAAGQLAPYATPVTRATIDGQWTLTRTVADGKGVTVTQDLGFKDIGRSMHLVVRRPDEQDESVQAFYEITGRQISFFVARSNSPAMPAASRQAFRVIRLTRCSLDLRGPDNQVFRYKRAEAD